MYDSTDGKKAGILKDTYTRYSDSTSNNGPYAHENSTTITNSNGVVYAEAPEFIDPVADPIIMNTPRYQAPINPDYLKLAQIAYDTVLRTMQEGEKTHPSDEWQEVSISGHTAHVADHLVKWSKGFTDEPHLEHLITRCAMIKFLDNKSI
jgi:hypothetical protein